MFEMFGVPHDRAVALAGWADEVMVGCILDLYRSAVDVGREWGPAFHDVGTPGLVVLPSEDPFLSAEGAGRRRAPPARRWPSCRTSDTGGCCRTPPGGRPP